MIVWYYQIRLKVVWKVEHRLMDTITRTKTKKSLPLRKIRVHYILCAVYHKKNNVIPRPVIAAILDVILNILQR